MVKKRMNEIAIICKYGRQHNLTYGRVVELLSMGLPTREEIGLADPAELKDAGKGKKKRGSDHK